MEPRLEFPLLFFFFIFCICFNAESKCTKGCDLALASYYVWVGFSNLTTLSQIMKSPVLQNPQDIVSYNKGELSGINYVQTTTRVNVPFPCDCIDGENLGYEFKYPIQTGDTYVKIATQSYSNLTTVLWLQSRNSFPANNFPNSGTLNVMVNCYCGDSKVSKDHGLFITYPLRAEDSLDSIANQTNVDRSLLQRYNPGVDFSKGSGVVFIPGKDENGAYVPLPSSPKGLKSMAIVGVSVGAIAGFLLLTVFPYLVYYRKKKEEEENLLSQLALHSAQTDSNGSAAAAAATNIKCITVDKSVEFSYEELAQATNNFSMANKIGQGGFGSVYYAELRGEKAAVKKMESQKSREFLAELKVLTNVHHLNLVRLIGYCVKKDSLFLVYEYIDNGNLSQHLRDSGREPLPWSRRVKIALDSARGLEYIHEHTVPLYIHRDIKSANILIDQSFRAKVADFGLTKLTEVGSSALPTDNLAGTFGYMPPEYAYGTVSPKLDVFAFGVVLFELISAKEALFRAGEAGSETKCLVTLFEEALEKPNPKEHLQKLVDPRLGDQYTVDSVYKMAKLAQVCTDGDPDQRPSMRSVLVTLMTLSSTSLESELLPPPSIKRCATTAVS